MGDDWRADGGMYRWVFQSDPANIPVSVDDLLHRLLEVRGVSPDVRDAFRMPEYEAYRHDPNGIPDFGPAVDRLRYACARGESVAIFGDYDVDGVTSSVLLAEALTVFGVKPRVMLPHREHDGYGLSVSAVRSLVPKATLLVTVDNGTNAHEEIAEARQRGAEVVVIDHHEVQGDCPDGALVVNPARSGTTYPFPRLAAVGVTFLVAREIFRVHRREGEEKWLLDLVALGTLADRVPLRDENRAFVKWGLKVLRTGRRPGVVALAEHAGVQLATCDARTMAFSIIPRLNAAGRMRHADLAFQILTTRDRREGEQLATALEESNTERRASTARALDAIRETATRTIPLPSILCVAGPWPAGLLGLLAGRVAEEFYRPAVVIGVRDDTCVASIRGNGTVNLVDLLGNVSSLLTKFGGHANAAGFSFPRAVLPAVTEFFTSHASGTTTIVRPSLQVDCSLSPELLTVRCARELLALEPHGEGNARPVFLLERLRVLTVRPLGSTGEHLRFEFVPSAGEGAPISAVAFRWRERTVPSRGEILDVVGEVHLDQFRFREKVDLHIRDVAFRVPDTASAARVVSTASATGGGP